MVVMLLVTILISAAIPRFGAGPFQDPIKKSTRWMTGTVKTLRAAAVRQQKQQTLVLDLTAERMWMADAQMNEAARQTAADRSFKLPSAIKLMAVQFPDKGRISTGTVEIHFYPSGYSDQAVILLEKETNERYSWVVEPLLPKVRFYEEWVQL
jgi:Tfp pilus assembly protein FimT